MPWWLTATYLNGLSEQGVIGDPKGQPSKGPNTPGNVSPLVDYASGGTLPPGFKTRRAG